MLMIIAGIIYVTRHVSNTYNLLKYNMNDKALYHWGSQALAVYSNFSHLDCPKQDVSHYIYLDYHEDAISWSFMKHQESGTHAKAVEPVII